MVIAIDINAIKEYSLKDDISDNKTIFLIGQIDSITRSYVDDENALYDFKDKDEPVKTKFNTKLIDIIRFGVKGWKNFKDVAGFDVEFKTEEKTFPIIGKRTVMSDESISRIPSKYILELSIEIITNNTLTEEDKKK